MTQDNEYTNGHASGRWITEGGRLFWIPADESAEGFASGDDVLPGHATSENPSDSADITLPPGAPEAFRVRAALAWLDRQRATERAIADEFAFVERERQRQRDAEDAPPPRRRQSQAEQESPEALEMARHDATSEWFEYARAQLVDLAERSSGRALVEWYLWLLTELPQEPDPQSPLAQARWEGESAAHEATRQQAERLAMPDLAED